MNIENQFKSSWLQDKLSTSYYFNVFDDITHNEQNDYFYNNTLNYLVYTLLRRL